MKNMSLISNQVSQLIQLYLTPWSLICISKLAGILLYTAGFI